MNKFDKENIKITSQVSSKITRKIIARKNPVNVWFGLGMMGLIGWSVVIPTVIGVATGKWLNKIYPQSFSWSFILLMAGLILGCLNAWHWMNMQSENIQKDKE